MSVCVVLATAPKGKEGERLARLVLKKRLVACVNILKDVSSLFWWEGKIDRASEVLLVMKTTRSRLPALVRAVAKAHSYSVCEVIALPVIGGNKPYIDWVKTSCAKEKKR
jgi:periplasmic divalent cation tolerance protein